MPTLTPYQIPTTVMPVASAPQIQQEHPGDSFCIASYSDKPKVNFGDLSKYKTEYVAQWGEFLGVELEVELKNFQNQTSSRRAAYECNALLNPDKDNPFVLIKNDGSLQNGGFEMCSSPVSLKQHKENWDKFFNNVPENLDIRSTCGMHVHISREPLSFMQIGKILAFIHNSANKNFIVKIAGREGNDYCRYDSNNTAKHAMPQFGGNFGHYSAVNLSNSATIEIRIFKATLNKEEFLKNLEFCHALVKFCFPGVSSLNQKSYTHFCEFVQKHGKIYPNLFEFLKKNGFISIPSKSVKKTLPAKKAVQKISFKNGKIEVINLSSGSRITVR